MLGIVLIVLFYIAGALLLEDCVYCRLRCTQRVEAAVEAVSADTLMRGGRRHKMNFPIYRYTVDGQEFSVKDFNAGKHSGLTPGQTVILYCSPKKPDRFYVEGRLWHDVLSGVLAVAGGTALLLLYLWM